ncbi:MAG: DUF3027 domain-containing protein [Propionibacteriaceae bacterium]|nr:DUF3027 domain-containing protein [Propionibacteriaceae bacterium]
MTVKTDAVTSAAVDVARRAAVAEAGQDQVGEHLGVVAEGDRLVTHSFVCLHPGYRGWRWVVTVVRAPRARTATVNDVVLLPGEDALLAPPWVPWADRIAPGDVRPGTLLATPPEDPRLVPGYTAGADPRTPDEAIEIRAVVRELGLGRTRVLSKDGRDAACQRWLTTHGPDSFEARQAPAPCSTCGYFIRLRGGLGAAFGACANAYSGADGCVISVDYGCGAHSDVVEERRGVDLPPVLFDDAMEMTKGGVSVFD